MQPSVLFIPDISGFTKFVNETEINHSQHIINELINIMIEANQLDLNVAEIEGDAVFFFKSGALSFEQIRGQAKKIYIDFHSQIKKYDSDRICNCGACATTVDLNIKFVVHQGPVTLLQYSKLQPKPHGKDVVAVHRLLKNNIKEHEYILYSEKYLNSLSGSMVDFSELLPGEIEDSELGKIPFKFEELGNWQNEVPNPKDVVYNGDDNHLILKSDIEVHGHIKNIHQMISDFRHRHLWNKGVDIIEFNEEEVNRVGSEHYCLVNGNRLKFETINAQRPGIEFAYGERLKEGSPLKDFINYFLLEETNSGETKVTLEIHVTPKNFIQKLILPLIKPRIAKNTKKILLDIKLAGESFRIDAASESKSDDSSEVVSDFHLPQTRISG